MNTEQLGFIIKLKQSFIMGGKATVKSTVAADLAGQNPDPNVSEISEEFVIPGPKQGEHQSDYISRCIGAIGKEYDQPGQAAAVCYGKWRDKAAGK